MIIKNHRSASTFLESTQALLEAREAENNLILGLATTLERDITYYSDVQPMLLSLHLDGICIGACLQTPPYNLIIYCTPSYLNVAIPLLCKHLEANEIAIPGIIGPKQTVQAFNKHWTAMIGHSAKVQVDQLIYRLDQVLSVPIARGNMRQAEARDLELMTKWTFQFRQEAMLPISEEAARDSSIKKIKEGTLYLWETNEVASMAAWTRPTRNGVTIASVYTPPEFRGKGYATSCVATLSKLLLDKYQFCALFTDQTNPTSNGIYQKIGYQVVDESLQCVFLKK